jgi:hypothetical protein
VFWHGVILGKEKGLGQIRIIIWLRIMGGNHRFGNRQDIPLRMIFIANGWRGLARILTLSFIRLV